MIGSKTYEIGPNEFLAGVTSGANTEDGGLSNETTAYNPIAVPGVLYAPGAVTDASTNLTDEIIASCEDPILNYNRALLDDTGAVYTLDGSTLTKQATCATDNFTAGETDMVPFVRSSGLQLFIISTKGSAGDLVKWDGSTGLDESWWKTTLAQSQMSGVPYHPLLVYEQNLFVGDGSKLHRIAADLTVSNTILQLTYSETITALGVDKGTGKMLIATVLGNYVSNLTRHVRSRIYLYDGFSNKTIRVIETSGLISSFKNTDSTTYAFYGNKLGYFTGAGIKYLRTLTTATGAVHPHLAATNDNALYWAEGFKIMALGETLRDNKVFYPALQPSTSSQNITCLMTTAPNTLGYSYASSKLFTHDISSVAAIQTGGATVYSKRKKFERHVTFNGIIFEFDQAAPSNVNLISVQIKDSNGNTSTAQTLNTARADLYEWEVTWPTIDTRSIQVILTFPAGSNVVGIRRATVFYTPKE